MLAYEQVTPDTEFTYKGVSASIIPHPRSKGKLVMFPDGMPASIELDRTKYDRLVDAGDLTLPKREDVAVENPLNHEQAFRFEFMKLYVFEAIEMLPKGAKYGGGARQREIIDSIGTKHVHPADRRPSPSTLYKWLKAYRKNGLDGLQAIVRAVPGPESGGTLLDSRVWALAESQIQDYFYDASRTRCTYIGGLAAFEKVVAEYNKTNQGANLLPPGYTTYKKWCQTVIDPKERLRATHGRNARALANRNVLGVNSANRPFEIVEGDGSVLNIAIEDDEGNYLGILQTFAMIDVFSKTCAAITFSVGKGESSDDVIDCIKFAVTPKPDFGFKYPWPQHGQISQTRFDGGTGYKSLRTCSLLAAAGIKHCTVQTHRPDQKSIVERFFLKLKHFLAESVPGYLGDMEEQDRKGVLPQKSVKYKLKEIETIIRRWVVENYHQTSHQGMRNKTPQQKWDEGIADYPVEPITNTKAVDLLRGQHDVGKVSGPDYHKGLLLKGIRYNDPHGTIKSAAKVLNQRNLPTEFQFWYSDKDISKITVLNPLNNVPFEAVAIGITESMTRTEWETANPMHAKVGSLTEIRDPDGLLEQKRIEQRKLNAKQNTKSVAVASPDKLDEAMKECMRGESHVASNAPDYVNVVQLDDPMTNNNLDVNGGWGDRKDD